GGRHGTLPLAPFPHLHSYRGPTLNDVMTVTKRSIVVTGITIYDLTPNVAVAPFTGWTGTELANGNRASCVFLKAKSPPICRSTSGLSSIWSSTSPPQRHSASKFRPP